MSSRTPLILNFLLTVPVVGLFALFPGWGVLMGVLISSLLVIVANVFMFAKALWKHEYKLAFAYFTVAFSSVMLFTSFNYSKIGG